MHDTNNDTNNDTKEEDDDNDDDDNKEDSNNVVTIYKYTYYILCNINKYYQFY